MRVTTFGTLKMWRATFKAERGTLGTSSDLCPVVSRTFCAWSKLAVGGLLVVLVLGLMHARATIRGPRPLPSAIDLHHRHLRRGRHPGRELPSPPLHRLVVALLGQGLADFEGNARKILEGEPANLLETVAERIAAAILKQPRVVEVKVRVSKRPPLPNLNSFAVEITRPVEIRDLPR